MKKVLIIEDHDSAIITIKDVLNEVFNYGAEFVVHKTFNKHLIEKEIEELSDQETDAAKEQLAIAKAKIAALESSFYEKI